MITVKVILIVECEAASRLRACAVLARKGYRTEEARDLRTVLEKIAQTSPAVVIIGGTSEGPVQALAIAARLRAAHPRTPLLFFASDSTEDLAIAALKAGFRDYIRQPAYEELAEAVARCLGTPAEAVSGQATSIIGRSEAIARTCQYLRKVAATECNVLITGETGTGKELVAEAIHQNSPRSQKPFVTINCAAIPDSLLESELFGYERGAFTGAHAASCGKLMQADGGTVFFDEIGEMDLAAQAKILRAIENKEVQRIGAKQNRPVDIRILAATNQDLEHLAQANRFRRDLYFRVNVTQIRLPALRDRTEDIPDLVEFFVAQLNRRAGRNVRGLSPAALERLALHPWTGNIRELRNLIEALFVNHAEGWIEAEDLPDSFTKVLPRAGSDRDPDRSVLLKALQATGWNKSKAAQKLNWSRMTLYRRMAQYQIVSRPARRPLAG